MEIQVISAREDEKLSLEMFRDLALFALEHQGAPVESEVSVALIDIPQMSDLNHEYRNIDGPTDVLSFPCDDPADGVGPSGVITLGDVIIAPEIAAQQADQLGHSLTEELELLLVHGVLHLLGFDHIDDADAEIMQAREREVLAAWRSRS